MGLFIGNIILILLVNLVLVGPSGCGKSTIMNILSSLITPTKGDVIMNGKIGYMFQGDHLLEWRIIIDNIKIALEIQKNQMWNFKIIISLYIKNRGFALLHYQPLF